MSRFGVHSKAMLSQNDKSKKSKLNCSKYNLAKHVCFFLPNSGWKPLTFEIQCGVRCANNRDQSSSKLHSKWIQKNIRQKQQIGDSLIWGSNSKDFFFQVVSSNSLKTGGREKIWHPSIWFDSFNTAYCDQCKCYHLHIVIIFSFMLFYHTQFKRTKMCSNVLTLIDIYSITNVTNLLFIK